jgi:NADPH-dependent curcumin reductase CurA
MNIVALLIASLAGGLISALLSNIPFVNWVNCLCCAGLWMGGILAVWVYRQVAGSVTPVQGLVVGAAAGLVAGVCGFFVGLIGIAGMQAMIANLQNQLPREVSNPQLISGIGSMLFNVIGIGVDIFFGAVGGLIGGLIFQKK